MPLTELVGGQTRTYQDRELIPHSQLGRMLFVSEGAVELAIRKSNSQVEVVRGIGVSHRALTPAKELPKILVELAKLPSANGPYFSYARELERIDMTSDFSIRTPNGAELSIQYGRSPKTRAKIAEATNKSYSGPNGKDRKERLRASIRASWQRPEAEERRRRMAEGYKGPKGEKRKEKLRVSVKASWFARKAQKLSTTFPEIETAAE